MNEWLLSIFNKLDEKWEDATNEEMRSLKELQKINDDLLYIDLMIQASYNLDDKRSG